MKITLLTPALAAILGLALAGAPVTVQAQTSTNTVPAATPAPTTAKKAKPTRYSGLITALDASSVTVTSTKKTLTLAIAPTTTFLKDGKKATLADFAVGDKVTGSYTTDATGVLTAHSLHTKTPKPVATTTAPATTPAPAAAATPAAPAPATTPATQ
jgi:hypothetical protein